MGSTRPTIVPSVAALSAAGKLAAVGAHVVSGDVLGSQMGLHVGDIAAVDHGRVAEDAAEGHGGAGRVVDGLMVGGLVVVVATLNRSASLWYRGHSVRTRK